MIDQYLRYHLSTLTALSLEISIAIELIRQKAASKRFLTYPIFFRQRGPLYHLNTILAVVESRNCHYSEILPLVESFEARLRCALNAKTISIHSCEHLKLGIIDIYSLCRHIEDAYVSLQDVTPLLLLIERKYKNLPCDHRDRLNFSNFHLAASSLTGEGISLISDAIVRIYTQFINSDAQSLQKLIEAKRTFILPNQILEVIVLTGTSLAIVS